MLHSLQIAFFALLFANGLRVTIGAPPVSYWFRSRSCPTCNGVGHVRKVKALRDGAVTVTRNGETLDVDLYDYSPRANLAGSASSLPDPDSVFGVVRDET